MWRLIENISKHRKLCETMSVKSGTFWEQGEGDKLGAAGDPNTGHALAKEEPACGT